MVNKVSRCVATGFTVGLAFGLLGAVPVQADSSVGVGDVLSLRVDGAGRYDFSGYALAAAGDVNGDGTADFVVGAPGATGGSAYVVFGGSEGRLDAVALGDRGLSIRSRGGKAGTAVAGVGDINGDGYDDVLIGAPYDYGNAYVVFGGSAANVHLPYGLDAPVPEVLRISGDNLRTESSPNVSEPVGDRAGTSVAGIGDVNGDGIGDMLIGAPVADHNGRNNAGSAYVVFGGSTSDLDLANLGDWGLRIDGASAGDYAGRAVAGIGDVNGDGIGDMLIGAPWADHNGRDASGSAYVVFGGSTSDLDLADLGERGFRIDGASAKNTVGGAVAGAGDVNGDGVDDLLIGVGEGPLYGRTVSGSAYVVFGGSTSDLDLADLGERGFRIDGVVEGDHAGQAVAGAGDVDGDGYDDVLIGVPLADNNTRKNSGSAYLVFGGLTADVNLARLGDRGVRIDGERKGDYAGWAVAGAGDVDGDGYDDILIGARRADRNLREASGSSYLVPGRPQATLSLKARGETKKIKRSGRTTLVHSVKVGEGQKVRFAVKVLPKKARKTVSVKQTKRRVVVSTRKTPNTARIRVQVASHGPGYLTRTWTRTWRMVGSPVDGNTQTEAPLLLAMGDSWAGGWVDREWNGYVNRLLDDLRLQGTCPGSAGVRCKDLLVRNMAQNNATTTSLIGERLADAVGLLRERNGDQNPGNDVVVTTVTIGGLDAFQPVLEACAGGVSDACRATVERVFATYEANTARILSSLRSAAGDGTEIVATAYENPIPHCYVGAMGLGPLAAAVLEGDPDLGVPEGLNDITRRVAAEHSVKVAETFGRLKVGDWVGGSDCVHPNASGHEKIAAAFAKALQLKTTRPGAVRVLKHVVKGGKAQLSWRKARRAERYQVRISDPGGTTYGKWTKQKKRAFVLTVHRDKTYRAQIRALGPGGLGPINTVTLRRG